MPGFSLLVDSSVNLYSVEKLIIIFTLFKIAISKTINMIVNVVHTEMRQIIICHNLNRLEASSRSGLERQQARWRWYLFSFPFSFHKCSVQRNPSLELENNAYYPFKTRMWTEKSTISNFEGLEAFVNVGWGSRRTPTRTGFQQKIFISHEWSNFQNKSNDLHVGCSFNALFVSMRSSQEQVFH